MKNVIKNVLLICVVCMGYGFVRANNAHASEKLTVAALKNVTGQAAIKGKKCTIQTPACSDEISVSSGYCWATHPVSYSACSSAAPSDTCTPVKVRTCIRNYYQPADANGILESATSTRCLNDGVYENTVYNEDSYIDNGC